MVPTTPVAGMPTSRRAPAGNEFRSRWTLVTMGRSRQWPEDCARGGGGHGFGYAMRGKDHRRAGVGNLLQLLDENRALALSASTT